MLMLARKEGEAIMVGDEIRIVIVSVEGRNIKVGVEAPRDIPVHREEVYRRIRSNGSGTRAAD
jgi:carbon storage regulator